MPILKDLPENTEWFHPHEGDNDIIILPFNHEGEYRFEYWGHIVSGGGFSFKCICPNTASGFCPICAAITGMNDMDKVTFKPKRKVIYNVIDLQTSRTKVKLWDVAWYFSQKEFERMGLNINVPTTIPFYFERHGVKFVKYYYESQSIKRGAYISQNIGQIINPYDFAYVPEYDQIEQAFNMVYNVNTQQIITKPIIKTIQTIIQPTQSHREYKRIVDLDE